MDNEKRPEENAKVEDLGEIKIDELDDQNLEDASGGATDVNEGCNCNCSPD